MTKNNIQAILLTGAGGFIGSYILEELIKNEFQLVVVTRNAKKIKTHKNVQIIEGAFYDKNTLDKIDHPVNCIVHCAAIRGESNISESEYREVNVDGTKKLLEYAKAKNIKSFMYISSVGVLGTIPKNSPATKFDKVIPEGKYHQTKWQSEQLVNEFNCDQLKTTILRPTITYGIGDDGFVPKLIQMVQNKRFLLAGNAVQIHLLNVTAFSQLIIKIIKNNLFTGETYIVADKHPVKLNELVNTIYKYFTGTEYPGIYKMPGFVFAFARFLLRISGQQQLLTSVQLISKSWTYDTSETEKALGYAPVATLDSINKYLKMEFSE